MIWRLVKRPRSILGVDLGTMTACRTCMNIMSPAEAVCTAVRGPPAVLSPKDVPSAGHDLVH